LAIKVHAGKHFQQGVGQAEATFGKINGQPGGAANCLIADNNAILAVQIAAEYAGLVG
jgi:hypothetical protein